MRRTRPALAVLIDGLVDATSHVGLLYLDSDGLIVERSSCARKLLNCRRGLGERNGRLTADRLGETEALERLLAPSKAGSGEPPVTVRVEDGRCLVVYVMPVVHGPAEGRDPHGPRVVSCVMLVDPWAEISVSPETLTKVLGLTPAQSQIVASLVRGMTVREIAEATQRAPGSVRWHVKRALEKTGARRQSDLVRMAIAGTSLRLRDRGAGVSWRTCPIG